MLWGHIRNIKWKQRCGRPENIPGCYAVAGGAATGIANIGAGTRILTPFAGRTLAETGSRLFADRDHHKKCQGR